MRAIVTLRRAAAMLGIALMAWPVVAHSQADAVDSDQLALAVGNAEKANMAAMAKYSWRVKSTLAVEGETKATVVKEMRFNTDGELDITTISSESTTKKKRGLRGRIQEDKAEDFAADLEKILTHSFQYVFLSKGTMVDLFDSAKIKQVADTLDVGASNVFVKGDELFLSIDPAVNLVRALNFKTTLDEDEITGSFKFARMETGLNKMVRFDLEVPTQKLDITSETFDWIEQK